MDKSMELFVPLSQVEKDALEAQKEKNLAISYWQGAWLKLKRNKPALFAMSTLGMLVCMAIMGPIISPYTYYETQLVLKNTPPSSAHWFGTDDLGRDLFTRCWWGTRISLLIGLTASFIDLVIGVFYGGMAALLGNKTDECLMRIADILYGIPYLLVTILLMVIMGPGIATIILALTFTGWINMARIVRSQMLQIKQQNFVKAAYAFGASNTRVLMHHLVPNTIGTITVTLTLTVPAAIFSEAFLSFLGLGVQAPIASLGTMINDGLAALRYYPWRIFFPAGLISLTILSFNLLGDSLRDALDPRFNRSN